MRTFLREYWGPLVVMVSMVTALVLVIDSVRRTAIIANKADEVAALRKEVEQLKLSVGWSRVNELPDLVPPPPHLRYDQLATREYVDEGVKGAHESITFVQRSLGDTFLDAGKRTSVRTLHVDKMLRDLSDAIKALQKRIPKDPNKPRP